MAGSNLARLFPSISELSTPKLCKSLPRWGASSATRLITTGTGQPQAAHGDDSNREREERAKPNPDVQNRKQEDGEAEEDDGDGIYINKETSEIGGPRGPEPTRYGDWERAGRCYDF